MKILGIVTSPRCAKISKQRIDKLLATNDIFNTIYELGYEGKVSNSEALLLAAMCGASGEGADVEVIYPGEILKIRR